jgi:hypothetical protein
MDIFPAVLLMTSRYLPLFVGCDTNQDDDCRNQVYKQAVTDKALIGHVIANKTVPSPQLCRIQCFVEPKCVSSNFDQNAHDSSNCQLSSSEAETHPSDLIDKPGFIYQGTEVS